MYSDVGKRVKLLRMGFDVTQKDLAAVIGIKESALSLIETSRRYPQPSTLRKITEALGVDPSVLVDPEDQEQAA